MLIEHPLPAELAGAANRARLRLSRRHDPNHGHGPTGAVRIATTRGPRSCDVGAMCIPEFRQCINARQRYSGPVARSIRLSLALPMAVTPHAPQNPREGVPFGPNPLRLKLPQFNRLGWLRKQS
jgi:hypothetical protein